MSVVTDVVPKSLLEILKTTENRKNYQEYPIYYQDNNTEKNFIRNLKDVFIYMLINVTFASIIIITWLMQKEEIYKYLIELYRKNKIILNDIEYYVNMNGGILYNLHFIFSYVYINFKLFIILYLTKFNLKEKFDYTTLIILTLTTTILITFIILSSIGINNI
jgi:hypothetical protein